MLAAQSRPPIGFIVEGDAEYHCYPSLVARIAGASGFKIPRLNAGGCGAIVRDLQTQLRDITIAEHPYQVVVTLDLLDVVQAGLYPTCAELVSALSAQSAAWLASSAADERVQPTPEKIKIVIQVPKFESWLVADIPGLAIAIGKEAPGLTSGNVDSEISDPVEWIRTVFGPEVRIKTPRTAREIVSRLDPDVIRANSHSFDKFHREVALSYHEWCTACGYSASA